MLAPIEWLNEIVEINTEIETLADKMTMTGSKVEGIEELAKDLQGVVVGKIEKIEKHPDADKLVICQVNVAETVLQIVTGATNIRENDLVPVATHGAILPNGMKIKKGKLRGVVSEGMLCSGEELGLSEEDYVGAEVYGILILKEDYPCGMDIKDALKLGGKVIDFEITSNRADCYSIIGLAREIAVTLGTKLTLPEIKVEPSCVGNVEDEASITVKEPQLCPRYCARVVKNIKIKPSPMWLKRRLAAAGVRPINNIVDISNYVMLEMNQPMHAFDLDKISNHHIIVRKAKDGEEIKTLDDQQRQLTANDLLICDDEKPIAIAGVMGGANSEISDTTTSLLFESALFDGASIRDTSKRLGLRSEASSRYEKGLDIFNAEKAINRAVQLVQLLEAGDVVDGMLDECHGSMTLPVVRTKVSDINQLLGLDLSASYMTDVLTSLAFGVEYDGEDVLDVTVPSFRNDIERTADIAEEVLRIYGYDKIPMTLMENTPSQAIKSKEEYTEDKIKTTLAGIGMYEILTTSFASPNIYKKLNISQENYPRTVKIKNPLGEDQKTMRTTMVTGLLDVIARNYNRSIENCGLFEMGRVFSPKEGDDQCKKLPIESKRLAIGGYGKMSGFFVLKSRLQLLFESLGWKENDLMYVAEKNIPWLHPGRCAKVFYKEQYVGVFGELHPLVAKNYSIDTRVDIGELDADILINHAVKDRYYQALPKFPSITRDFALVVDKGIPAYEIEQTIKKNAGAHMEKIELFDVYEGKQVPEGKKSMAYSVVFRATERTLKDKEVAKATKRILQKLEDEIGATLR